MKVTIENEFGFTSGKLYEVELMQHMTRGVFNDLGKLVLVDYRKCTVVAEPFIAVGSYREQAI